MKRFIMVIFVLALIIFVGCSKKESNEYNIKEETVLQYEDVKNGDIVAEIVVENYGSIKIKLFKEKAPKAVENFVTHSKNGYYDGSAFNKVVKDFIIQAGRPAEAEGEGESIWGEAFEDETDNGLYPVRGALCMANTGENTNASQFFIVTTTAEKLEEIEYLLENGKKVTFASYISQAYGRNLSEELLEMFFENGGAPWLTGYHTVFGQVYEGMDIVDKISEAAVVEGTSTTIDKIIIEKIIITEISE